MRALGALGALAAAALAVLITVPPDSALSYGFQRNTTATDASAPITPADGLPYTRRNIRFNSHGTACDAWLYTPQSPHGAVAGGSGSGAALRFPVLVMAHGLGAQKELGLHRFADAFASAGLAVLAFDYRTFGGSDGEPRHWASPRRHLEDWRAALGFVKSGGLGPEYDIDKVGLWGTSYAGGHVLVVASEQPPGSVAAVISMIPHLDGLEASKASVRRRGLLGSLKLVAAGLHDRTRAAAADVLLHATAWLRQQPPYQPTSQPAADSTVTATATVAGGSEAGGLRRLVSEAQRWLRWTLSPLLPPPDSRPLLEPAYVKLVGLEGELAIMQLSPEQLKAYYSKHPAVYEGGWRPVVLSRFTLETSSYSPIQFVPRVAAPVLFVSALRDQLCPAEQVRKAVGLLPRGSGSSSNSSSGGGSGSNSSLGELLELDCTHFDAYLGEHLAVATDAMVRFVRRHMLPSEESAPEQATSA